MTARTITLDITAAPTSSYSLDAADVAALTMPSVLDQAAAAGDLTSQAAAFVTATRNEERFDLRVPVEVMPVGLDGRLEPTARVIGQSLEVSGYSIGFQLPAGTWYSSQAALLGLKFQGAVQYAGIVIRRVEHSEFGVRIGAEFGGAADELLNGEAPLPSFDGDQLSFGLPHSAELYDNWVAAGVMEKRLLDRILVCPKCCGIPTIRNACRKCGSGRVSNDRLMHHFRCAHVGFVRDFTEPSGDLTCPKCRQQTLVVGADFEYLVGESYCGTCGWRDSETELYGHCLKCNWRFELNKAREQELYGYHVHRLDPLAVIAELC